MSTDNVAGDQFWRQECLQMWEFMASIEGMESTRAARCLSKMLCAHYDSMSVLKLVTQRDLIEYAGLKPGDALRIVTAVKALWAANKPKPKRGQKRGIEMTVLAVTTPPEPTPKKRKYKARTKAKLVSEEKADVGGPLQLPENGTDAFQRKARTKAKLVSEEEG